MPQTMKIALPETFVRVTDLCGRELPYIINETALDDAIRDFLAECDGETCFMGEMQYDFLAEDHPEVRAAIAAADRPMRVSGAAGGATP